ncbi:MAG: response regulator, partial [Flavobacteriaceae bacterium]|nr:response regulator [Flavobacteriaceae bacterium]
MKQLVSLIIMLSCSIGFGQGVYEIDTAYPVHEIDNYLKIYKDSTASFTPEQILKDSSSFYLQGEDHPPYFLNEKLLWGKVELYTPDSLKGWTLHFKDIFIGGPAWIKSNGKVDVFAYVDNEQVFRKKTGYGYSRNERDIAENWILNRVRLDDFPLNKKVTLIIRAEGSKFGYPPFFRLNLRGPSQPYYHEINQFNNSFNIFMLGVTFIILLYHVLQYLYLKDVIFLYFSIWVFACCMTNIMATGAILDAVHRFGFVFWMFFSNSVYFLFWFFGRSFIQSKSKFPILDKLIVGLASLMIIQIIVVIFLVLFTSLEPNFLAVGYHAEMHVILNILGLILSIAIATRKDNFARYFGIGAIVGLALLVYGSMWSAGWIKYPGFIPHSWAMFAQIVIFSFGIAYRRQMMMKEHNEEKLMAQRSIAEMQRVRDLDEIKTRFFANISHEFRTPLALIKGPLNRAKNKSANNDISLSPKDFKIIDNNANRLQGLIDQLLDLSKLESGKLHLSLKRGDIVKQLRSLVFSFESMAERKNISLNTQFPKEIENALFDKDKLEKIVGNLLSNAFKYTPKNGSISVIVGQVNGSITIEISDTGKGINKDELKLVFDRFYRVEGSEEKGSGIGLSLVKELVDLHNGNLSVDSVIDYGTSFKVTLPITLEGLPKSNAVIEDIQSESNAEFEPAESLTIDETVNSNSISKNLHVALIVEDNADLRHFISDIIKDQYEVLTAENGLQGERMAFEHIPDIVISDIMMPKKDGYELCHSLKVNPKTSHIPIIMLTAKAGQ